MKNSIKTAIEELFEKLPFLRKREEQKEKILSLAYQKFDDEAGKGVCPAEAAGKILIHCASIDEICCYLDIKPFIHTQKSEKILMEDVFYKVVKKLRKNIYILSFLFSGIIGFTVSFLKSISIYGSIVTAISWTVSGTLLYVVIRKQKRLIKEYDFFESSFENSCRKVAAKKCDLYTKKLTNTTFGIFSLAFLLLFSILLSVTTFQFSLKDVLNIVIFYLTLIQLSLYLFLKNFLCRKIFADFFIKEKTQKYLHELRRIGICSAGYYLFFLILLLFFRNKTENSFSLAIAVIILYFILAVFYNFTRRRNFISKNIVMNIKKIVCYTLTAVCLFTYNIMRLDLYLLQPYINTVASVEHSSYDISYDEDTAIYTLVTEEDNFKILQLTDIHLGGSIMSISEDTKALKACYQLITASRPDFVVVTGDLVFPLGIMSFSFNNNAPIMQFANFMRNTGIPWAFTYGNHDTEALATLNRAEVDSLMKSLSYKSSKNLLYPYVQPDIYGRSNQMIEVRHTDGSLMQALFLIDSNDYIEAGGINEYDYIHDNQVEWYKRMVLNLSKREGKTIPSMIFTHIPLREYKEANDLYENGSNEVIYYYGILGEKMIDKICCSKYDSQLFDTAVELGSTQAIFFGHDHYNNQSLEYRGIRMTYGYSIDYLAMPGIDKDTEQRGATLITIKKDGSFAITPYKLTDLEKEK